LNSLGKRRRDNESVASRTAENPRKRALKLTRRSSWCCYRWQSRRRYRGRFAGRRDLQASWLRLTPTTRCPRTWKERNHRVRFEDWKLRSRKTHGGPSSLGYVHLAKRREGERAEDVRVGLDEANEGISPPSLKERISHALFVVLAAQISVSNSLKKFVVQAAAPATSTDPNQG